MSKLSELTDLLEKLAGKRPPANPGFLDDLGLNTKRKERRRDPSKYSPELVAKIREMYKAGYKIKEITKTLGVHHTSIYDVVDTCRTNKV